MRKISVRLSVAFLFLATLPLACTSSPGPSATGSGGSAGSSARTGGAGGGASSTGGASGGSSSTGSGGSTSTGGGSGTSDATGGSSATGGEATGGIATGGGGGSSDATGGSGGTGGNATGGYAGGMSTGGGGGTSAPDGGTGGDQGDAKDGPGIAEDGGDDTPTGDDGGGGEAGASCTDQAQNGAETDVDCGGGTCTKCGSGMMCTIDDDCRSGSCASDKCADAFAATAPVTQSGNMWRITLGTVIFEVDSAVAGKIATFSIDGTDVVVKNMAATGSVFWTSPQSDWNWPPPAEMDTTAYIPSASGNVLTMTGPLGADNLSISKRYWGNFDHQAVTIEYTIHNGNSAAVSKAPWEITRVYPGGLTFFPNSEPAVRLGDASFSIVPSTSAQGALWFKYNSSDFTTNVKGGADGLEGWAAHIACGTGLQGNWSYPNCTKSPILIKQWTDIPAASAAPAEKEVEIYADGGHSYVEFEQQGAYQSIPAGGSAVWTMHWLLRYLPITVAPTAGSAALLTWVRGQLL